MEKSPIQRSPDINEVGGNENKAEKTIKLKDFEENVGNLSPWYERSGYVTGVNEPVFSPDGNVAAFVGYTKSYPKEGTVGFEELVIAYIDSEGFTRLKRIDDTRGNNCGDPISVKSLDHKNNLIDIEYIFSNSYKGHTKTEEIRKKISTKFEEQEATKKYGGIHEIEMKVSPQYSFIERCKQLGVISQKEDYEIEFYPSKKGYGQDHRYIKKIIPFDLKDLEDTFKSDIPYKGKITIDIRPLNEVWGQGRGDYCTNYDNLQPATLSEVLTLLETGWKSKEETIVVPGTSAGIETIQIRFSGEKIYIEPTETKKEDKNLAYFKILREKIKTKED